MEGIEKLTLLESLDRIAPDEQAQLDEYRRLLDKILLLPGVEFTATFGFHILGIFPPEISHRQLEHTLLELNIPEDKIEEGSGQVGATTDVVSSYEILHEAGAIVIPAHVNSTHGVAMQNLPFGGQTKITFTQSPYIHALEATDLESNSRRSVKRFFNGSKPDYPRRMHIVQGSDAHRLNRNPNRETDYGVAERMTEVQLTEPTFEALKELFESDNFSRIRPYRPQQDPYDFIRHARSEGNTIVQGFHTQPPKRRGRLSPLLRDIVAMANGNGGSVYVGLSANPKDPVAGVPEAPKVAQELLEDVARHITPPITISVDIATSDGKQVLIVSVPTGTEKPYAVAPGNIYVRHEGETTLALRDEIVELVRSGVLQDGSPLVAAGNDANGQQDRSRHAPRRRMNGRGQESDASNEAAQQAAEAPSNEIPTPRTGVEIVESVERDGVVYHSMRDLRNLKVVHNVTRDSARALWRYAILQREESPCESDEVEWNGRRGFWKAYKPRNANVRFNLTFMPESGDMRVYYGVTEEGLDSAWREVVPDRYLKSDN